MDFPSFPQEMPFMPESNSQAGQHHRQMGAIHFASHSEPMVAPQHKLKQTRMLLKIAGVVLLIFCLCLAVRLLGV